MRLSNSSGVLTTEINGTLNVTGNVTVEGIFLEQDTTNHRIYDNSTCVIIKGDTSELRIC